MRIMLVDEYPERAELLEQALQAAGYQVVAKVGPNENLYTQVGEIQPDVIIIDTESPSRDTLGHICCITREQPRPIVMFTSNDDRRTIRAALQAGVSAYVVDGLSVGRIRSILEVAIAQFEEFHTMRRELEQMKMTLAERKIIERAKGVVMKQRRLDEDEAYKAMRKMAMDRNIRMIELAKSVLAAAEILG